MNTQFQNALKGVPQNVPPIWMMRQAGRYHKHYQALRAKHSFMELCKNAELASEVALGPVEDFDFDVSILFSDLLFPLEAIGMGLEYKETGPELGFHLTPENFKTLKSKNEAMPELQFQKEAMRLTRQKLPKNKSLIGFVGGPWTLFTYAVEGAHKGSLIQTKKYKSLFPHFCELMVPLLIENMQLQFEGGAEVVMILDTAGGEVSPNIFQNEIWPHTLKMIEAFSGKVGYYAKGNTLDHYSTMIRQAPAIAGFGFDHRYNMHDILTSGFKGFKQGNFDQSLMFLEKDEFKTELLKYLEPMIRMSPEKRAGWVCGLGHGLLPKTPEDNVRTFVKTVREVFA